MDGSLYRACSEGNKEVVQKLVSFKSVKYVDPTDGSTPLHQACRQGWLDIVKLFIEKYGCDPYVTNRSNQSLLHYACRYGHMDIVQYLINEQHSNPMLRDNFDLEPLDHAVSRNIFETNIAVYICQHCISSEDMLNPKRIETTVNLIQLILRTNPYDPEWKTANGDNILKIVWSSKSCISHMPSAVVLEILHSGAAKKITAFQPDWRTADCDKLLELVCQSKTCLSQISSALILKWLEDVTIDLVKKSIPDSKTADGETLLQLVFQSETIVSRISSPVLSKWLEDTTLDVDLEKIIIPEWKTADGDTLLQLVCQSEMIVSRISSAVLSKWLEDTTLDVNLGKIIIPERKTADGDTLPQLVCQSEKSMSTVLPKWLSEISTDQCMTLLKWKTADGDTLLQLVCQSETFVSRISSAVLSKWLDHATLEINLAKIIIPELKTEALLQLVCRSETIVSRISSPVLSKWLEDITLDVDLAKIIIPEWKTADGDTLLQLVCQSETIMSQISSAVLSKWLEDATIDINSAKIIIPELKTADGDTLLQLVFQSETIVSQISSPVLSKWLEDTTLAVDLAKIIIPEWKTADGDTLLQLVCQSETIVSRISSAVLSKWLEDATIDINSAKIIIPELKTADGDTLLQLVFQSEMIVSRISSPVLPKWLEDKILDVNLAKIIIPEWKTADGDTLLELLCQSEMCLSQIPTVILLKWLILYGIPLDQGGAAKDSTVFQPDWTTADGDSLLQLVCQSQACLSQISSTVILKWLNATSVDFAKISSLDYKTADGETLLQLVCRSETIVPQMSSAVLSKWLRDATLDINLAEIIVPEWKTADGVTLLQIVCQSRTTVSQISSTVLSKWLRDINSDVNLADILIPHWKTADGDTLLQLVCRSETIVSQMSLAVLSKWLRDATLDINLAEITVPEWKTADGVTLLQIVCQSRKTVSQISSTLLSKWLRDINSDVNLADILIPHWKTADGDTLLQLVCQSETIVSQISSAVLSKWLRDTTLDINLAEIIVPEWKTADGVTLLQIVCQSGTQISSTVLSKWLRDINRDNNLADILIPHWKTADGDTLLQLVCQSEIFLSQISSAVLLKWLHIIPLYHVNISLPDSKTADDNTLLQLVLQSAMTMSQTSSTVLLKWLNDTCEISTDLMKMVDPNWKTLDGDHFFHVLCLSEIEDKKLVELMQHNNNIREDGLNNSLDNKGNTALHIACLTDRPGLISFLLNEAQCDPIIENKMKNFSLDLTTNPEIIDYFCQHDRVQVSSKTVAEWINNIWSIDDTAMLSILKALVDNHKHRTKDGSTLLHIICSTKNIFRDTIRLIHYLLTEGHCDPNCLNSNGKMPLQLTSDIRIMKKLVRHGAKMTTDIVFKVISSKRITETKASELFTLSTKKRTMLWNPNDLNSNGYTALHLACKHNKPAIVDCLLTEAKCDPNANDRSPLELTTKFGIAKMLIKHGARVTPELVLRFEAREAIPNKYKLIELMLTTWNPDDRDSNGYTALHLACKAGSPTTINRLLTVAHCDPNIKNNNEEVPLQMTTNPEIIKNLIRHGARTSIMYESYQKSLGTNEPVEPPVKVFIVGNPSVGKSTLTAVLKKKVGIVARILSLGKVTGVDQKTVGIVPHDLESEIFGRVTLYDFAGHREFYSGHAALLQTAIQSTPPVFLLVVNLCEEDEEVIKNILYWITFLENQCASVSCKPHVILVGSHADHVKRANPKNILQQIIDSLDTKCFTNMEFVGFVAMNCQYHESAGMSDLRRLLIKSCDELRIHEPITFNAHCFLVFLIDNFMNQPAVTIETISKRIEDQDTKEGVLEFLPQNIEALYKICLELNDRGHILLLKDRIAVENSYIVIDKEFLLSKISGTVFAPEGFKQYKQLSTNTGVVPLSKIEECFPDKDPAILMGFLTHLEFCHEISDQALHQLISEQYSQVSGEHYYLFPGLISVQVDDTVWKLQSNYDYGFGWIMKCTKLEQFFSSRFLQVLLLRLAFSFALKESCDAPNQGIGIHRNCHLWKNGIFWGSVFGMQTLVKVTSDNKSVILLARFQDADLLRCVQHRSEVINTILQCKKQFCPRVFIKESFIDSSSPLQYPLNLDVDDLNICTLEDLATAVVSDYVCPSIILQCNPIPAKNFLSFEPYLEMKVATIEQLWNEKNEKKVISERFLSTFVQQASEKLALFIKILVARDDQLYQNLLKWRDGDMNNQKTYYDLRKTVDQYSVFAGRNVLVSVSFLLSIMHAIT